MIQGCVLEDAYEQTYAKLLSCGRVNEEFIMTDKDKILIWGTGAVADGFVKNGINGNIVGFIQTHKGDSTYKGLPVYGVDELPACYDYIVVANTYVSQVYETCIQKEIDLNKVIFIRGGAGKRVGISDLGLIKKILGKKNYTNYCGEFNITDGTFFQKDLEKYNSLNTRENFRIQKQYIWPVIKDKYADAGKIGNYFWQDLWAARLVCKSGAKDHFDIGSRIDGFIAHLLASGIKVSLIDVREFPGCVDNLYTIVDDATYLRQIADESIESLSALCSLEHFGLGRYGDPINPEACFICFKEIQKKLKKGGNLYISVPVGSERVEFNAHRVFYASTIVEEFNQLQLVEFSCTAAGQIEYNVDIHKYDTDEHDGNYRYGLFHFTK